MGQLARVVLQQPRLLHGVIRQRRELIFRHLQLIQLQGQAAALQMVLHMVNEQVAQAIRAACALRVQPLHQFGVVLLGSRRIEFHDFSQHQRIAMAMR